MNLLRGASGALNSGNNVVVSTAAADVSAHTFADVSVVRAARFFEQRGSGHDLAGGAIATLKSVMLQEGGLDGMQFAILSQALDGGDLVALVHDGKRQTRIYAPSVYMNRACAALAVIATFLRAGKLKVFAQRIEKSDSRLQSNMVLFSIDVEHHRHRARDIGARNRFSSRLGLLHRSGMEQRSGCDG